MGQERSNRRMGEKKSLTHSPACSTALRFAPLHSAPLRATPLAGSFTSEEEAMYLTFALIPAFCVGDESTGDR